MVAPESASPWTGTRPLPDVGGKMITTLGPLSRAIFLRLWPLLCWIDTGPLPPCSDPPAGVVATLGL